VRDATPAFEIRAADLDTNARMLSELLGDVRFLIDPPDRVVELCGGVGTMTRVLSEAFPAADITTHDLDATCVKMIEDIGLPRVQVVHGSYFDADTRVDDLVVADFNMMTYLRFMDDKTEEAKLVRSFLSNRIKYLLMTDSATSKLHLNFKSYGLSTASWSEYVRGYSRAVVARGYKVVNHVRAKRAAMLLFARE
jgi:trans-aconitate methyltransferase